MLEKATPLKASNWTTSVSIAEDVEALVGGQPEIRNLQTLALFSTSHPIALLPEADEEDVAEERRIWEEGRLFERIFEGLMAFLDSVRVSPNSVWSAIHPTADGILRG